MCYYSPLSRHLIDNVMLNGNQPVPANAIVVNVPIHLCTQHHLRIIQPVRDNQSVPFVRGSRGFQSVGSVRDNFFEIDNLDDCVGLDDFGGVLLGVDGFDEAAGKGFVGVVGHGFFNFLMDGWMDGWMLNEDERFDGSDSVERRQMSLEE
jgi:hypothetical protein